MGISSVATAYSGIRYLDRQENLIENTTGATSNNQQDTQALKQMDAAYDVQLIDRAKQQTGTTSLTDLAGDSVPAAEQQVPNEKTPSAESDRILYGSVTNSVTSMATITLINPDGTVRNDYDPKKVFINLTPDVLKAWIARDQAYEDQYRYCDEATVDVNTGSVTVTTATEKQAADKAYKTSSKATIALEKNVPVGGNTVRTNNKISDAEFWDGFDEGLNFLKRFLAYTLNNSTKNEQNTSSIITEQEKKNNQPEV